MRQAKENKYSGNGPIFEVNGRSRANAKVTAMATIQWRAGARAEPY